MPTLITKYRGPLVRTLYYVDTKAIRDSGNGGTRDLIGAPSLSREISPDGLRQSKNAFNQENALFGSKGSAQVRHSVLVHSEPLLYVVQAARQGLHFF